MGSFCLSERSFQLLALVPCALIMGGIAVYAIWHSPLGIPLLGLGGIGMVIMLTGILFNSFGELPTPETKRRVPPTSPTIH